MTQAVQHAGKVAEDGRLFLRDLSAWTRAIARHKGHDVVLTIRRAGGEHRSLSSNNYLWEANTIIARETGNDPEIVHYALKREALRLGVLEPNYITLGDKRIEAEPTTRTDQATFNHYLDWLIAYAASELHIVVPPASQVE